MADDFVDVMTLSFGEDRLTFSVTPQPVVVPGDTPTYAVVIEARAWPFSGRVEEVFLADDLRFFAMNLERMTVPGEVVFGGERMVELVLSVEPQVGGAAERLVLEASLTGTADQWPRLTMLLFDQGPFWVDSASRLRRLVDQPSAW